jgi:hypothetical protein
MRIPVDAQLPPVSARIPHTLTDDAESRGDDPTDYPLDFLR